MSTKSSANTEIRRWRARFKHPLKKTSPLILAVMDNSAKETVSNSLYRLFRIVRYSVQSIDYI